MKFLVTGGCGFIGSNFLNHFVPNYPHYEFVNIDALTYAANLQNLDRIKDSKNYSFIKCDITDKQHVHDVFNSINPNVIVHFAAESHVDRSIEQPCQFASTNVIGTLNLLEAVKTSKCLFQHVSTDEVYGSLDNDIDLFTEETRYDPSSPYSASKAASDHFVRSYIKTYGINAKITNCSNNYGPFQFREKLIPLAISQIVNRRPIPIYGNGQNVRDWLYVIDHCEAIWNVIFFGLPGETYNIGGNCEHRNIDIVMMLINLYAKETGTNVKELTNLIEYVVDRKGHDYRYAIDSSKISSQLGWTPKETLESGLRKTVEWYLENTTYLK